MKHARRPSGASMIVLTLIIALLIVFVVGLFAFELNRVEVARAQLRSGTEAAALAAVTTLASQQSTNTMQAHTDAVAAALSCFRRNEVLGTQLDGADPDEPGIPQAYTAASNPDNPPVLKEASLYMEFLDPNSNPPNAVVPMGDDRGKAIRCYGNFHYQPAFSAFTGVGDTYLHCMSTGGVPDLDAVLCFDISGSIDDQTKVTLVKRYVKYFANNANGQFTGEGTNTFGSRVDPIPSGQTSGLRYFVCNDPDGSQQYNGNSGKAIGQIYSLMDPPPTGTSLNAVAPQGLEQGNNNAPFRFHSTLRGIPNQGGLPPNNSSRNDDEGVNNNYVNTFTDEVVNLDGNVIYGGYTYVGPPGNPTTPGNPAGPSGNFAFPSIPVLVEASRGNLDNAAAFASSGAQSAFQQLNINVTPQAGYKAAYDAQAFAMLQPIGDAKRAASLFYTLMNNNTKGHFGLVTFTTGMGSNPNSTWGPYDTISNQYGGDTTQPFPNPMVPLNPAVGQTGYTTCVNAIPPLVASQSTNIEGALATAYTQLTTNQRPNAKRAIVLFTDGQPTVGQDPPTTTANNCKNAGIPIYCIGLAQNAAIVRGEVDRLNDHPGTYTFTDPITGSPGSVSTNQQGVAAIAQNGSKFYLVTNSANLGIIFGNIARSLCALVK